jgi:hypothetical protein
MELKDFIYNYAKIYLKENVKTVLAQENWQDKDCDVKYVRYIQDYITIKALYEDKEEQKILAALQLARKTRIEETYKFLFDEMIKNMRSFYNVTDEIYDKIKKRITPLHNTDEFNFDYIRELRNIEEEYFSGKGV